MKIKNRFSAKEITGISVLLALVIVLQAFGGSIPIGAVTLNFTLIPIVLGAIMFGPWIGGFLGLACGIIILFQVITTGAGFYALIWANDPIVTTLTCLIKTTAAGILAGYAYRLLADKKGLVATFVASGIVPVVNTALFILGALCMTDSVHALAQGAGQNVLAYILVGLVTFNFFVEFAINLLVAPSIHRVVEIINKTVKRK